MVQPNMFQRQVPVVAVTAISGFNMSKNKWQF